jgi:hypothetical protein
MVQLILLAAVVGVGWYGYRKFVAEAQRVSARVREAEREAETGAQGTLVQDPETGEYRLKKPEE